MAKTKTSKKQKKLATKKPLHSGIKKREISFEDIPISTVSKSIEFTEHKPYEKLSDWEFVKTALLEALSDGDEEAFKEILKGHYDVLSFNKVESASKLSRRTLYHVVSKKGNPSLKTICNLMSGMVKASKGA